MNQPSCLVRPRLVAALALAAAIVAPAQSRALFDAFLDVPGIPGEATSPLGPNQIAVLSYSVDIGTYGKFRGSGACTAKEPKMADSITVTKTTDKASPKLLTAAAIGTRFPTATLRLFETSPPMLNYLTITMTNALITAIRNGGTSSGTEVATEQVTFSFASVTYEYVKLDVGGVPESTSSTWSTCSP